MRRESLRIGVSPAGRALGREAGLSLLEAMLAVALVGVGLLGTILTIRIASSELTRAREVAIARLAISNVIEICTSLPVRGDSASDVTPWLFHGEYEIARTAQGTSFRMPTRTATGANLLGTEATVTEDGVAGWLRTEFPVPPLVPVAGFTHAGRLLLHVNETLQPSTVPTAGFPFPATPGVTGLTRLDCDGDAAATTTNLRVGYDTATHPTRLVPARVIVEWRSDGGTTERLDVPFLIVQPGF